MANPEDVRKLALSFDDAEELPHFEKTSFRVSAFDYAQSDKYIPSNAW